MVKRYKYDEGNKMGYSPFEIASVVKFSVLLWLLNEVGHMTLTIASRTAEHESCL